MLSDQDKRDILADANDPVRREAFTNGRRRVLKPMTWAEYFKFLKTTQEFFGFIAKPHKITGDNFKL